MSGVTSASHSVLVRMYHVGLGDAFLLSFAGPTGPRKVLIDCGVHFDGEGRHSIEEVIGHILDSVTENGVPRIHLVVATHRHQDHVSGFADPRWRDVEVDEVWMPWTEDFTDPLATRIRERQGLLGQLSYQALAARQDTSAARAAAHNNLTNQAAMKTLHNGFAGEPRRRFLPATSGLQTLRPRTLRGITVHILGPSRSEAVIRELEPPVDESYLRLAAAPAGGSATADTFRPFRPEWMLAPEAYEGDGLWGHLALAPEERSALESIDEVGDLAASLASAINGTSLFLQFSVGRARLLFPGDAQWGSWHAAMSDPARRVLLEQTTFLKVGHHGSHNATPRHFVEELLPPGFWAMVSTLAGCPLSRPPDKKWDIPRPPLLERLQQKSPGRVARSDLPLHSGPPFAVHELYTEVSIPT